VLGDVIRARRAKRRRDTWLVWGRFCRALPTPAAWAMAAPGSVCSGACALPATADRRRVEQRPPVIPLPPGLSEGGPSGRCRESASIPAPATLAPLGLSLTPTLAAPVTNAFEPHDPDLLWKSGGRQEHPDPNLGQSALAKAGCQHRLADADFGLRTPGICVLGPGKPHRVTTARKVLAEELPGWKQALVKPPSRKPKLSLPAKPAIRACSSGLPDEHEKKRSSGWLEERSSSC